MLCCVVRHRHGPAAESSSFDSAVSQPRACRTPFRSGAFPFSSPRSVFLAPCSTRTAFFSCVIASLGEAACWGRWLAVSVSLRAQPLMLTHRGPVASSTLEECWPWGSSASDMCLGDIQTHVHTYIHTWVLLSGLLVTHLYVQASH